MTRLLTRLGTRTAAVALLLSGLTAGIYLGRLQDAGEAAASVQAGYFRSDVLETQLLKQRQNQHIAARARRDQAENVAARKAAAAVRKASTKARSLETKQIARKRAAAAGPVPFSGPIPGSCNEFSGSRAIGCALTLEAGFGIAEFPCLNNLWNKESGWNYKATNPGSGAYGIPQAYPGSKMASAGADWKTNPATQIKWGLGYVKGRYKTPCGAWAHFQANHSY